MVSNLPFSFNTDDFRGPALTLHFVQGFSSGDINQVS